MEEDREAFFDALETLYRMPTKEGYEVYGDSYKVCFRVLMEVVSCFSVYHTTLLVVLLRICVML